MKHSISNHPLMDFDGHQKLGYIRVDFHTHTEYSPDSLITPLKLIETAKRKGINKVAVTDHDEMIGAYYAKEIDPETVITGSEIQTTCGEILAFFMNESIPSGLPPKEVITRLREQNAFISVSHPFDSTRKGAWEKDDLLKIVHLIDAVETFNARCILPRFNWLAEKFASEYELLGTHGSDAHAAFEIGRGSLLLPPFTNSSELRQSLKQAVSPRLIQSLPWVHLTSRYATWIKKTRTNKAKNSMN